MPMQVVCYILQGSSVSYATSYDVKTHMQSRIKKFRTMIHVNKYLQSFTKTSK